MAARPWRTAWDPEQPAPETMVSFGQWGGLSKGPLGVSRSAAMRSALLGHWVPVSTEHLEPWFAPGGTPQSQGRLQDPAYERPGPAHDN